MLARFLIAAAFVAAAASTASAECAWVLWGLTVSTSGDGTYVAMSAWTTRQECQQQIGMLDYVISPKEQGKRPPVCLPDTVDPRGAKGK
jgi:hypothetical protein